MSHRCMRAAGVVLQLTLLGVWACGGQDVHGDAGVLPDAAADAGDSGPADTGVEADAGQPGDGGPGDSGVEPDSGIEPDSGVIPDAGIEPDSGVIPDAGMFPDSGVIPDAGMFPDSGVIPDSGVFPDSGVIPDAGFSDAGSLDADLDAGPTDADPPDADLDAGLADTGAAADSGVLDAGPMDGGLTPGFHYLTIMGNAEVFVSGGVIGTCPPLNPFRVCTLQVQDGAFVDFGNTAPGHCYLNNAEVVCGYGNGVICNLDPSTLWAGCNGVLSGDVVLAYTDEYRGAVSVCVHPPLGCPTTITCGWYGINDCGNCAAGSTCIGDGHSASCLPYACSP